jgi:DNA mismatch repair ATPase MutS
MEIDQTTLRELSILPGADDFSLMDHIDCCITTGGKERLYEIILKPLNGIDAIIAMQQTLRSLSDHAAVWPSSTSNGTILVIGKYYSTTIDPIPENPQSGGVLAYRWLHRADHSFLKYSTEHALDFLKDMQGLVELHRNKIAPEPLQRNITEIEALLNEPELAVVHDRKSFASLSPKNLLRLAHFLRYRYKQKMQRLLYLFFELDAWRSMALASIKNGWVFPEFRPDNAPLLEAQELRHPLLDAAVSYDICLNPEKNFLFLTGANMAGKSTFIRTVGLAVFLAHCGMGVPAKSMKLSCFDGLLSNISNADNIRKGESYFLSEVLRIKSALQKINDGRSWMLLADEMFKGTNVQDAMKCSLAVINGLVRLRRSAFIVSTHLYEIAESLRAHTNIRFSYFETGSAGGKLHFSYRLREGVSNDRFGYLILENEGVVDLLDHLR